MEFSYKQLSLYSDVKTNDLFILPNGNIKELGPVEIEHLEHLSYPYDEHLLFDKVQHSFELCYSKVPPIPAKASSLAIMLGAKNYQAASKNKKLVMLTWQKEDGYKIYPTEKHQRFGYKHLLEQSETLGMNLEQTQLFSSVKKALELSTV